MKPPLGSDSTVNAGTNLGFDCLTTDVGAVTGSAANNGKHLIDECCKSCSCTAPCKYCMMGLTTAQCSSELKYDCTPCDTRRRTQGGAGDAVAQQVNESRRMGQAFKYSKVL